MTNLAIKEVDFQGNTLIAAQDNTTEKVYVGVKWVCEGIGLSRGQVNNERKRIQTDVVLSVGERNLMLPTNGGEQNVQCLELDFLPLWLAKISITPTMKEQTPEIVDNLIQYQLRAKEVLANAFVRDVTQLLPKTYKDALKALLESLEEKERIEEEKKKLEPKAEKFDTFINAENTQTMLEVAKVLGYSRTKLFKFLREKKILMKNNTPYQEYLDKGYFKVKELSIQSENISFNKPQTLVTAKGVDFIDGLLKKHKVKRII